MGGSAVRQHDGTTQLHVAAFQGNRATEEYFHSDVWNHPAAQYHRKAANFKGPDPVCEACLNVALHRFTPETVPDTWRLPEQTLPISEQLGADTEASAIESQMSQLTARPEGNCRSLPAELESGSERYPQLSGGRGTTALATTTQIRRPRLGAPEPCRIPAIRRRPAQFSLAKCTTDSLSRER